MSEQKDEEKIHIIIWESVNLTLRGGITPYENSKIFLKFQKCMFGRVSYTTETQLN